MHVTVGRIEVTVLPFCMEYYFKINSNRSWKSYLFFRLGMHNFVDTSFVEYVSHGTGKLCQQHAFLYSPGVPFKTFV